MKQVLKKATLADRLLLLLLVAGSAFGIFAAREAVPESPNVMIEVNGRPAFTAALAEDRIVTVEGSSGPVEVEIKEGRARIRKAHCPNELCVKEGWVSRGVIVCLPGGVVVYVGGSASDRKKDIDAVTG